MRPTTTTLTKESDALAAGVQRDTATDIAPMATIGTAFTGLNQLQSGGSEPPDTQVSASSTRVLQAVNSRLRLTDTVGLGASSMALNDFFGVPVADGGEVFDPKVYYDRNAANQRFYVVGLQAAGRMDADPDNDISRIHLAISRSTSPTLQPASWCQYEIDGIRDFGTANQSWADFPGLGVGADAVVISANQFRFTDDGFTFAVVRALNKIFYANNAVSCPIDETKFFQLQPSAVLDDPGTFTLQPAQHYTNPSSFAGAANPAYLVSTRVPTSSSYRVWRLINVGSGLPQLQLVLVSSSTYSNPFPATGPGGGATKIDLGDVRVLQVAGRGNSIYAVHTLACQFTANTPLETCFRMVRFTVGQNAAGTMTATQAELQGLGGGNNQFYHYPGIAVNNLGEVAVVFQANTPATSHFLSSRLVTKAAGAAFPASIALVNGTCGLPNNPVFARAGDYAGAQTATDGDTFWLSAEHARVIGGICRWDTRVARVSHP